MYGRKRSCREKGKNRLTEEFNECTNNWKKQYKKNSGFPANATGRIIFLIHHTELKKGWQAAQSLVYSKEKSFPDFTVRSLRTNKFRPLKFNHVVLINLFHWGHLIQNKCSNLFFSLLNGQNLLVSTLWRVWIGDSKKMSTLF